MEPDRRESERGIALILVLVVLPLVAILMTQLSFETTISSKLASNLLANQQFKAAIQGRLVQMRLRLVRDLKDDDASAQEGGAYDHMSDTWGPKVEGGGTAGMVTKGDKTTGDDVTLYTQVVDEQSKFNLNLLLHRDDQRARRAQEVFRNLLDYFRDPRFGDLTTANYDLSEAEARELTTAVVKFLIGDERNEKTGKPTIPDPAPQLRQTVFSVEDLVFCDRRFVEKRLLESFRDPDTGERVPGLVEFLTVFGDGRVNANTAPIQVLRAMFKEEAAQQDVAEAILKGRGGFLNTDEDQEQRSELLDERRQADQEGTTTSSTSSTSSTTGTGSSSTTGGQDEEATSDVYKNLNDLSRVEGMGDTALLRRNEIDVARDFTVRSNFFRIVVTARRGNFLRQQRVVFQRHAKGCVTWSSEVRHATLEDLPETLGGGEAQSDQQAP